MTILTNINWTKGTRGAPLVVALVVASLVTAGCDSTRRKDDVAFDGVYFSTKADKIDKENRAHFQVQVRSATKSLEGAKEAGRYAGTKYCIEQYGSSVIQWIYGPDQDVSALPVRDGSMFLEGICKI